MSNTDKTAAALQRAHDAMCEVLATAIEKGVPVQDKETGEVHYHPLSAAHMAVALALFKHNNITALPTDRSKGFGKLHSSMATMPIPGADMQALLHGTKK